MKKLSMILCCISFAFNAQSELPPTKVLPTILQEAYDVKWYFIDLHAESNTTYLSGNVTIKAQVVQSQLTTFSFHLHQNYTIDSVKVDGVKKKHTNSAHERFISGLKFSKDQLFDVQIFYHGETVSPHYWNIAIRSEIDETYGKSVTWTLSEPNYAYYWFPVKQNLKDKADSSWVFITTSNKNMVASNGLLKNVVTLPNNKVRYEWKSNYPIAYYLISFAVSEYTTYSFYVKNPKTGDSVYVQNFIYDNDDCIDYNTNILRKTGDIINFFSDLIGPYPFKKEKFGNCFVPFGGMEHQTMSNIASFPSRNYNTRQKELSLIAHELIHQWFGDLVTCNSWTDIWLNEGITEYFEIYWAQHEFKDSTPLIDWIYRDFPSISFLLGSVRVPASEIDNADRIFYPNLTYYKGAILLHMIRYEINDDEKFFQVIRTYLERFAYQTASVNDFKNILKEITGKDFTKFFVQWFSGEGFPIFNIHWQQHENQLAVKSTQATTSTATTLFETPFDLLIKYTDNSSDLRRLFQNETSQYYAIQIPDGKTVDSVKFDPKHWLLAYSSTKDSVVAIVTANKQPAGSKVGISLYPNPAKDQCTINTSTSIDKIEIFNIIGSSVHVQNGHAKNSIIIPVNHLPKGIYTIHCYFAGGGMAVTKLLVN